MPQLSQYLSDASLVLILLGLALTQLGLPIPETAFIVAAGIVSQRMGLSLLVPLWSSCLAVLLGDIALYYLARTIGRHILERTSIKRWMSGSIQQSVDALFERHGAMAIFVARFVTGVRFAVFALAGMRRMPLRRFLLWDGLAVFLTVPVFASLGFAFAASTEALNRRMSQANAIILLVLVLAVVGYAGGVSWRRRGD